MDTEIGKYKTWIEGNFWDINHIESEIRKFCYVNNLDIIDLHSEKTGFLQKTCYFDIRGESTKLLILQKSLKNLE